MKTKHFNSDGTGRLYLLIIAALACLILLLISSCGGGGGDGETGTRSEATTSITPLGIEFRHKQYYTPDKDVPIVFTGLRPGEKLYEEILTAEEGTAMTTRKKIFVANDGNHFGREYVEDVRKLIRLAESGAPDETILRMLKHLVPSYKLKLPEPPRVRHLKSTTAGS